jgi:hypothetical protein
MPPNYAYIVFLLVISSPGKIDNNTGHILIGRILSKHDSSHTIQHYQLGLCYTFIFISTEPKPQLNFYHSLSCHLLWYSFDGPLPKLCLMTLPLNKDGQQE